MRRESFRKHIKNLCDALKPRRPKPFLEDFDTWSGCIDALLDSKDEDGKPSIMALSNLVGVTERGMPVFLSDLHRHRHALITGEPGTNKSALQRACVIQQIRRIGRGLCRGSVFVGEAKAAPEWLGVILEEARKAGLPVRFLTDRADCASCGFNFFLSEIFRRMSPREKSDLIMACFGLSHGLADPNTAFFEAQGGRLNTGIFRLFPHIKSPREMYRKLSDRNVRKLIGMNDKAAFLAENVITAWEKLIDLPQCNFTDSAPRAVLENQILPERFARGSEVVLVSCSARTGADVTRILLNALLRLIVRACEEYPDAYDMHTIVLDEGQELLLPGSTEFLFKSARSLKVSISLAIQSPDDLEKLGILQVIDDTVATTVDFSAKSALAIRRLAESSGRIVETYGGEAVSVTESVTTISASQTSTSASRQTREQPEQRMHIDRILHLNNTPSLCAFRATPISGLTRFRHPVFVETFHTHSPEDYQKLLETKWPPPSEGTIVYRPGDPPPDEPPSAPVPVPTPRPSSDPARERRKLRVKRAKPSEPSEDQLRRLRELASDSDS